MIVFGGVIEREVHNAFFTLDVRGWTEEQSELPRESWAQIEARLRDKGPEGKPLEDHEVAQVRNDWEEHMKKEKKRLLKAKKGQEEDTPKKEVGEEQQEENPEDVRAIKPHAPRHCTLRSRAPTPLLPAVAHDLHHDLRRSSSCLRSTCAPSPWASGCR